MAQKFAIGIDFGNSRCCIAVYDYNCLKLNKNPQTLLSNVLFKENADEDRVAVGTSQNNVRNAYNFIYDIKRIICKEYDEIELRQLKQHWTFEVTQLNGLPKIIINRKYSTQIQFCEPIALVSLILEKLVTSIKTEFPSSENETIDAVVTVPGHFNNAQRLAILHAAQMANINVLQLINEASATAISYGFNKNFQKNVLIFDFGSGRLDVSVVFIDSCLFKLLSNCGDPKLGGRDIDNILLECIIYGLQEREPYVDFDNPSVKMQLLELAEQAKIALTYESETSITTEVPTDYRLLLNRDYLEAKAKHLFDRAIECIANAIKNANLEKRDINEVILLGGSSQIPIIRKMVQEFFCGNAGTKIKMNHPSHSIAEGAAIYAASLMTSNKKIEIHLKEATAFAIGVKTNQDDKYQYLCSRGIPIPHSITMKIPNPRDNLNSVLCELYEDEHKDLKKKNLLGKVLTSDPSCNYNQSFVNICFEIDSNNILQVTEADQKAELAPSIILKNAKECLDEQQLHEVRIFLERLKQEKKYKEYSLQLRTKINNNELNINHVQRGKIFDLMKEINKLIASYADFDKKFKELKDIVESRTTTIRNLEKGYNK